MFSLLVLCAQSSTAGYHHHLRFEWNEAKNGLKNVVPVMDDVVLAEGSLYGDAFFNATDNESNIDIPALTNLAKSEYGPALYILGELNLYGLGVDPDYKKAADFFKRAAARGFNESLARLSFMYKYGFGVSRDSAKSVLYRQAACQSGSVYACLARANSQVLGYDETLNAAETLIFQYAYIDFLKNNSMYYKAAEHIPKLNENMTFDESENERLERELIDSHKYRAARGDATAEIQLGLWYLNGEHGLEVDIERAKRYIMKHQDDPNGAAFLGYMHFQGLGFPKDLKRAKQFFQKASDLGSDVGRSGLGAVEVQLGNRETGEALILQAAAVGNVDALHNLAVLKAQDGNLASARLFAEMANLKHPDIRAASLFGSLSLYGDMWDYEAGERIVQNIFSLFSPRSDWAEAAQKLWQQGNQHAAILIWIELLEIGDRTAVYRALRAIISCEEGNTCFRDEHARNDLIIKLTKFCRLISSEMPDSVFEKVISIYELRNQTEKAYDWFFSVYNNSLKAYPYWRAKSMLMGRVEMNLSGAFWDLSTSLKGLTASQRARNSDIFCSVISRMGAAVMDRLEGRDSPDWQNIYTGIVIHVANAIKPDAVILAVLFLLILLVRKRVEILYKK